MAFASTQKFKSIDKFTSLYGKKIQAIIGNSPLLVNEGKRLADLGKLDQKQKTLKGRRGAIGVVGHAVYLVIAEKATVPDMADIMVYLRVDKALNLDGGGSSALYYEGKNKVGPGRKLPNAILFTR